MKWITPSLAVGDWVTVLDADEATTWIQDGRDNYAVVADEATAAQVLHNLGLTDEQITDRLHFANTGTVLQ